MDGFNEQIDSFHVERLVIRLLEYASFPDLFAYPFTILQMTAPHIDLDRCRIPEARKALFKRLLPFLTVSTSLDEAISHYIDSIFRAKCIDGSESVV